MREFPAGEPAVRLRASKRTNAYGDEEWDWSNPSRLELGRCGFAEVTADELHQAGRDGAEIAGTIYLAQTYDIVYTDRIEVGGRGVFEIDGSPGDWRWLFSGGAAGMTVRLRRVEG